MDKCFVGGSASGEPKHVFKGQMSALYLFGEPLQQNTIAAMYRLGPGYKVGFTIIQNWTSAGAVIN